MSGRPPPDIAKLHVQPAQDDADLLAHVNDGFDAFNRFQDQLRAALAPMRLNPLFSAAQFQFIQVAATTLGNPPTFALQYRSSGTATWTTIVSFTSTGVPTLDTFTGYLKGAAGVASAQAVPIPIADGGTNSTTALSGSSIAISNGTQIVQGAAGTATTLLHGNAAGAPTYAGVSLANDTTANQGTATTVLHGNAAGQPSFAAVSLTADVSGVTPIANGGTNSTATATSGGVGYGTGSAHAYSAAGTSGQLVQSAGAGTPVWAGDTSWTAVSGGVGFQNSWVDYGSTLFTASFFKDACGFVHLRGTAKSGTPNTVIFTLPAGYRPSAVGEFATNSAAGFGEIEVDTSGNVRQNAGLNTSQSIDGITFDTR